jgi:heat shock protein HtpX
MVAELARAAHLPKPRVGVSQISVPNAFAYGRSQKDGRICVTQGIRELLNADELRAVLGHEMSHLRNRDMAVITMLSAIPMILYSIAIGMMPSNDRDSDNDSGESLLFGLAVFIGFFIVYYVTELLVLYGSRIREYYADRGSVRLGNEPHYLAAALYKLTTIDAQAKDKPDLQRIESARAFLFSNPSPSRREIGKLAQIDLGMKGMIDAEGLQQLRQKQIKLGFRDTLMEVFTTHPNMLKRIKALSELQPQCDLLPKNWTKLSGQVNEI